MFRDYQKTQYLISLFKQLYLRLPSKRELEEIITEREAILKVTDEIDTVELNPQKIQHLL